MVRKYSKMKRLGFKWLNATTIKKGRRWLCNELQIKGFAIGCRSGIFFNGRFRIKFQSKLLDPESPEPLSPSFLKCLLTKVRKG